MEYFISANSVTFCHRLPDGQVQFHTYHGYPYHKARREFKRVLKAAKP